MPAGRVAGKAGFSGGGYSSGMKCPLFLAIYYNFQFSRPGRSYHDINEEIIWASILMASMIAMLIILALCYIGYEKCQRKREYLINA
jgi:hypothetical protein